MIRLYLRSVVEAALTVACLPVALVVVLAAEKVGRAQGCPSCSDEIEDSAATVWTEERLHEDGAFVGFMVARLP